MTDRRVLVRRGVFAAVDGNGDVHGTGGAAPDGLFARDARHLSLWRIEVDGAELTPLTQGVLVPPGTRDEPPAHVVMRDQAVGAFGLAERVRVVNHGDAPRTVRVRYLVDADFADQFELRADDRRYAKPGARRSREATADGFAFTYRRGDDWLARTVVAADPAPDEITVPGEAAPPDADTSPDAAASPDEAATGSRHCTAEWTLHLPAHGSAALTLNVRALPSGGGATGEGEGAPVIPPSAVTREVTAETEAFMFAEPRPRDRADFTVPAVPADLADSADLVRACEQGLADLVDLRVPATGPGGEPLLVPGAGVPWFLTLFGRDSLLTSLFTLPFRSGPAAAVLPALAAVQGSGYDPARIEQPGKIVHEVRHGELAHFRQVPYGRYYGAVDATPLFLVLLHAYTEATGDRSIAEALEPNARAAVDWLLGDGGLEEHGYLVYTPDPSGLVNQCWKDSAGAICFPDGRQADGPIAVCEAQGYAFDALRRTADLAERVWGDPAYAHRLEGVAERLRADFHRDFPVAAEGGFPALALDGEGRQVDVLASNAGHLLWSGLLDAELGAAVGRRLVRPDFFSGWGVRTLASGQAPYHPLSYHRGSIWPHDNAVIVAGLARYGLHQEAALVTRGLVDAAARHGHRLPEVLAGYSRDEHPTPVPYPHACSPQAWSTTTPLALLTAMGG
ncbi:glycogen debranching enzyme [Spinactinospora alkalitolerans]|uniref:Glycogen debranching enzyme n=1 Tax=Spinactinospora alkalitolerans TaxID=687207 RepID=A0A852U8A0_9ACTN|nr:glycogen debranching N-terminal domain-containing protein [Spinactinospora alkalitolerans]NYE50294.1 glycogen debranching enzyme [Spinactinospora alkalitolerans]